MCTYFIHVGNPHQCSYSTLQILYANRGRMIVNRAFQPSRPNSSVTAWHPLLTSNKQKNVIGSMMRFDKNHILTVCVHSLLFSMFTPLPSLKPDTQAREFRPFTDDFSNRFRCEISYPFASYLWWLQKICLFFPNNPRFLPSRRGLFT